MSTRGTRSGRPIAVQRPPRDRAGSVSAPDGTGQAWFSVRNSVTAPRSAEIYIYAEIGGWGIWAEDLIAELVALDVDQIDVRINSPGGSVWDGVAIYNALINHPARVTVHVDALAASIASVIAMAGDELVMARQAVMMIHEASTIAYGNAAEMRSVADVLDMLSEQISTVYEDRTGVGAETWRSAMLAETWYTAEEAVAAGLADRVAENPHAGRNADPESDDDQSGDPIDDELRALLARAYDLTIFNFAGRDAAPAPVLPLAGGTDGRQAPTPVPTPPLLGPAPVETDWHNLTASILEPSTVDGLLAALRGESE